VNHRTGDQCILTFKPRGWRGKDAYEISGQVIDSEGNVAYEIAGRWNSQLIARAASASGSQSLNPDHALSPSSKSPEYILLWRNSEKPEGSPFNLTPFAISLNDCPKDTLKPYLCPTDCRLRPDQRAFEMGKYEEANVLKGEQEDRQRATRKAREEGRLPQHRPRWFSAETDGDTGERVWAPARVNGKLEYWQEREKAWKTARTGLQPEWKGVDDIFVEEPDFIKDAK
jgi:oxysterol-binding protein 1